MKPLIILLCLASTCLALTPKERELVQGLNSINAELRASIASQAAQIESDATTALFAAQKIESLTLRLKEAKQIEEAQFQDLLLQAGKIKALEQDREKAIKRADSAETIAAKKTAEAHRNALERDICLFALSVAITVLVMIYSGQIIGWITSAFPALTPYGIGLWIGLAILTFLSTFGASRGVLAMIASRL